MGFVIKLPGRAERVSYWTQEDATEYSLKLIKDKVLIDAAKGTPGQSVKFVVAEEGEYTIAVSAYSEDILIAEGSSTASIHDGDGFVTVDVYLVPKAKGTDVDVEIHWKTPEEQQNPDSEPHENQNSNNEPVMPGVNGLNAKVVILYDLNDEGELADDAPLVYEYGTTLSLKEPVSDYYDFEGWHYKSDFSDEKVTALDNDYAYGKILYAKWSYTVDYNANNETEVLQKEYYDVKSELNLQKPVRDGYEFAGWYTNSDFEGEPVAKWNVGENKGSCTLYASWEKLYEVQVETFLNYDIPDMSFNQYVILDKTHFIAGDEVSIKVKYDGLEYVFKNISVLNISTGEKFNLGLEGDSFIMPESDVCVHVDFLKLYKVSFSDSREHFSDIQYVPYGELAEDWNRGATCIGFIYYYVFEWHETKSGELFDFSTPIKRDYNLFLLDTGLDLSEYSRSYGEMISCENNIVYFNFFIESTTLSEAERYFYNLKLTAMDAESNLTSLNMSYSHEIYDGHNYEIHDGYIPEIYDGYGLGYSTVLTCDLSSLKAGEYKIFFVAENHISYDTETATPVCITDINNLEEYKNENIFYTIHIEE